MEVRTVDPTGAGRLPSAVVPSDINKVDLTKRLSELSLTVHA